MRVLLTTTLLILSFYSAFSQVGINTTEPSTTLDVRATNHNGAVTATDGLLVPRVNDLTVNGSVNGQLVYLITTSNSLVQGFYYWNGSNWTNLTQTNKKVTNELFIDDADDENLYYYVSVLVDISEWEVTRYSKADINAESKAQGMVVTTAQPSDLASVKSLSYN